MFKTSFTIEWGDCDEAGIAFYPNYFYWLDCAFQRLLRDRGIGLRELRRRFCAVTPIVEANSQFKTPARYDDILDIEVGVRRDCERRFRVGYDLSVGGRAIGTGYEIRAWAIVGDDGDIKGAPIDERFLDAIGANN